MKAKGLVTIVITLIAAVLFAAVAQAGGQKHKKPKKAPPPRVTKPSKPAKPPKPVINPKSLIPTKYSGNAVAVDLSNAVTHAVFTLADTGPLRRCGGSVEASVGATNTLASTNSDVLLSVDGASASVSGVGCVTVSTAEVTNFMAAFVQQGATNSITNVIAFTSASAEAHAECTATGVVLTASSQVEGLTINGTNVLSGTNGATGGSNQVITIPGGSIILNGQMSSLATNCSSGQITVAALFLMSDSFSGPIAFANAGIKCGSRVPPELRKCDKITGGGFIFVTSTNGSSTNGVVTSTNGVPTNTVCGGIRGTFALEAGVKHGRLSGRLIYVDHGMHMRVCSSRVTAYTVLDSVSRQIDYDVLINGVAGTARVIAADNGEPGRNDVFDITLSDGYHAGGNLSGGNLQLHICQPGGRDGDHDDDDDDDDQGHHHDD